MENFRNEWEVRLDNLLNELLVSKEAYRKLATIIKYPERSAFFKSQKSQREEFASVLAEELIAINNTWVKGRNLSRTLYLKGLHPQLYKKI